MVWLSARLRTAILLPEGARGAGAVTEKVALVGPAFSFSRKERHDSASEMELLHSVNWTSVWSTYECRRSRLDL
jgi:hypothetical protein